MKMKYSVRSLKLARLIFLFFFTCISIYGQDKFEVEPLTNTLSGIRINDLKISEDGLLVASEIGLFILSNDDSIRIFHEVFKDRPINSIYLDQANFIWLGTYYGEVIKIDESRKIIQTINISLENTTCDECIIQGIVGDNKNILYALGDNGLIYLIINGRVSLLQDVENANCLTIDELGNKWIGTENGLQLYDINNIFVNNFLYDSVILDIVESSGTIYCLSVNEGKIHLDFCNIKNKTWSEIKLPEKVAQSRIKSLYIDNEKRLWVASKYIFFKNQDGKRWNRVRASIENSSVLCINQNNETDYFLGYNGKGLAVIHNEKNELYFQDQKISLGKIVEIKNLEFLQDDSTLVEDSFQVLDNLFDILRKDTSLVINLNGHTSVGEDWKKLQKLSLSRSNQVKIYLVSKGIEPSRIVTTGYGSKMLKNSFNPHSNKNRRVEFILRRL